MLSRSMLRPRAGRSLLPAPSYARTTTRYVPRGSRARSVRCQRVVPCIRKRTGLRQPCIRVRRPFLARKRQPWRPRTFATDTYTRFTFEQPRSLERPFRDSPLPARFTSRRRSTERGATLSRQPEPDSEPEPGAEPEPEPGRPPAPGDPVPPLDPPPPSPA